MEDALRYAQELLKPLPGYLRVKVDVESQTLVPRFTFPDIAQRQYAKQLALITEATGWHVHVHPIIYPLALQDVLKRILPPGISCMDTPSIYQDRHKVGIVCVGCADAETIQVVQQRFLEETGWELELRGSAVEAEETLVCIRPHLTRAQAMLKVVTTFGETEDFYQMSVDDRRYTLWLHFYFPAMARVRYAAEIEQLARETGWRIDIDKDVHQKALVEAAQRLLPDGVAIVGKKSLIHEQLQLHLNCAGALSQQQLQHIQQQFQAETGWQLELEQSGQPVFCVAGKSDETKTTEKHPLPEHDALALVQAKLGELGLVRRPLVDTIRHILLVHCQSENGQKQIDRDVLAALEKETGWHIQLQKVG
jgi:hypothetical protein